jgi:GNAT superfamily N-acetyltransferase
MSKDPVAIREVTSASDRRAFVGYQWQANEGDRHWVPPLKSEVMGLITPEKNPWFEHAEAAFFLAERGGKIVGRISAQIDRLVLAMPEEQGGGPGTGHWGMLEAADGEVVAALLERAEEWLRSRGMTRSVGPFSLSIWDEPGLLVQGHDHSPTLMMGHHQPAYAGWVEQQGYVKAKDLVTYEIDTRYEMPPLVKRLVAGGERNKSLRIRKVDKSRFAEEAATILAILNDAWSDNWGFIPLTDAEIAYAGKKLKPIVYEELIRIAELDGEPVSFMMTLPDLNDLTRDLDGRLFPFGWAKLLWRLRKHQVRTLRVPLMGVVKRLQATRLAGQIALMLVEYIRVDALKNYSATRGEFGWVLEDNTGMLAIAEALDAKLNRVYRIYEKAL